MSSEGAPTKVVQLSVNLHPEVAEALQEEMARHNVSATEAVRRSIALLKFVRDEQAAGHKIAVIEKRRWGRTALREVFLATDHDLDDRP